MGTGAPPAAAIGYDLVDLTAGHADIGQHAVVEIEQRLAFNVGALLVVDEAPRCRHQADGQVHQNFPNNATPTTQEA